MIIGGIGMSRLLLGKMMVTVTAVAALTLVESAAFAADELEEIVVTAEKRSENVQNVPIAITAFTAEALQSRNLVDVHSLSNLTSGVNLDAGAPFSGDRSVLSASIRGIGQDDFAFNLNPGVGVYLDGVYLARTIGSNLQLLDVERIEVLKGPQGTLFGANTIGGAISIVTRTPGEDPSFIATATGGQYDRLDVGFTTDIPIIPGVLLSSLTVSSQKQTGWQNVIPYPANSPYGQTSFVVDPQTAYPKAGYTTGDTYGGTNVQVVRGKLLWNASDKLKVTFTSDWTYEDQTALPYTVLGTYSGNLNASTFSSLYNLCISNSAASLPGAIQAEGGPPTFVQPANSFFVGMCTQPRAHIPGVSIGGAPLVGAGYVGGPPGPYNAANVAAGLPYLGSNAPRLWWGPGAVNTGNIDTTYANGPDFARNDSFGEAITADYQLNDTMALKSISAYRQIRWNIGTDLDGTPETLQEVTDEQHQWQVSQEFQLLGRALNDNLHYVAGLFYFKEAGYVHDFVPFESLLYVEDQANNVENVDYAAFVNLDYTLGPWGFTAGGRYTNAQTYFLGGQSDLNDFPVGGGVILRYFPDIPDSQAWHIFDPKLGIQYHFTPDVMSYVTWSKGFKAGGWTTRLSAVITSPEAARYEPEYSKTWELGLKSEWFDHRLLANAAVYYTNYDGIQLNVQQGISPVYTNAGNAIIKGAELDMKALIGGGLQLNLAADYIDAYYTSVVPGANFPQYALPDGTTVCPAGPPVCGQTWVGVTPLDAKLPKTPKYKFTIAPQYDYKLPNDGIVRLVNAFTYTAEMFNDSLNTPQLRRPPTRDLDSSLHYISPDAHYDVAFGGTNLTDDRYVTAGSPNYGAGEVGGYYNPPRMWYLKITAKLK
jgi:iron complex outermembrane recepter protein